MRTLLLFRGAPGVGKSTYIEKNGLKPYTLCADDIRLLCQSPVLSVNGNTEITMNNDRIVWKTLFTLLEVRMRRGEFTVIDATNSRTSEMKQYKKLCQEYRYRIFLIDFSDVPIEECKRRNNLRNVMKQVPEAVIDKMYSRFKTQGIPSGITIIKPEELDKVFMKKIDLSEYKAIHHVGDVHGAYTALQEYLNEIGGIKDDHFYIFAGDYIDRGIENAEVIQFLLSIKDKPNVFLLEGNHEIHLRRYSEDKKSFSKEFELFTKPALDKAGFNKKDLRQLCRKFAQCAYYTYHGNTYLVTHGGLSTIPQNLTFVATDQMIHGAGRYNDVEQVADTFFNTTDEHTYQIFGHRNTKGFDINVNPRVYDLEGQVEFGGCLRCIDIVPGGSISYEIKNNVFREPEKSARTMSNNVSDALIELRHNKYVTEKQFGNISSFNFSPTAFQKNIWDEQTTKARGLFLDTEKFKVVARSYDKFFNINQREETKFDALQRTLQFPVATYVKENGFLGIVSWNEYTDDLFITSKSDPEGEFSEWLRDMVYTKISKENLEKMKKYIKENDVSFVFECCDMEHDPHIIDYPESKLVLLDIVYNTLEFQKYNYEDMAHVGRDLGLTIKKQAYELSTWQEFYDWYFEVLEEDYEYRDDKIEGFVIEDASGYMVKLKLTYYNFWKFMRGIAHETLKKGYTNRTSLLTTPVANEFYVWCKKQFENGKADELPRDIVTLRKMFYKEKENVD